MSLFLPFSASSSVPSFLGCMVSGWWWTGKSLALSLAFRRLWPPQGRKPHLSALSSQCLEQALALQNWIHNFQNPEQQSDEGFVFKNY